MSVQTMDPPEHTVLRGVLSAAYRARDMEGVERDVTAHAARLLATLAHEGGGEIMSGLARPLSLAAICDFLGVDPPDPLQFGATSDAILRSMDSGVPAAMDGPGRLARAELSAMVAKWLLQPAPGGMLAALSELAREGEISPDVLHNSVRVVFHAGFTTVYSALGNAVATVLRRRLDWTSLPSVEDQDAAVDELLRHDGPVQANSRICVEDAEVAGVPVRRGQRALLLLGAANRDPDEFDRPDDLVLDRRPNRHLAFGWGIHRCLGSSLARMVARVTLAQLALQTSDMRLAGPVEHKPQATQRCLHSLPVTCRSPREAHRVDAR